eukprot:TRINITY_DN3174_c0_g4_i1.p1 TRINITY_DN3174_c0_g4~~TRINITY_DN3174_c0_g4_i1.p1  ORF type:complete len:218 (+),score=24.64 TRINITY_DN3174_c0_g4_i1:147-800(+)
MRVEVIVLVFFVFSLVAEKIPKNSKKRKIEEPTSLEEMLKEKKKIIENQIQNYIKRKEKNQTIKKIELNTNAYKGIMKECSSAGAKQKGHVYVISEDKPEDEKIIDSKKRLYKIGKAGESVVARVRELVTRNRKSYKLLRVVVTPCYSQTEKLLHGLLKDFNEPQDYGDGKTEWFRTSLKKIDEMIDIVVKDIRKIKGELTAGRISFENAVIPLKKE